MRPVTALLALALALLLAAPAQAGVRTNRWDTFDLTERTCSGETVRLTVRVHFVGLETQAPDGRYIVSGTHVHATAATGVTDSGERYVFRDGSNSTSTSFEGQQGAATFTANIRLRLDHVGPGEGDDLVFHQVAHVTTSPDGEQVVSFSRSQGSVCV